MNFDIFICSNINEKKQVWAVHINNDNALYLNLPIIQDLKQRISIDVYTVGIWSTD